jgi:hypothetical protein
MDLVFSIRIFCLQIAIQHTGMADKGFVYHVPLHPFFLSKLLKTVDGFSTGLSTVSFLDMTRFIETCRNCRMYLRSFGKVHFFTIFVNISRTHIYYGLSTLSTGFLFTLNSRRQFRQVWVFGLTERFKTVEKPVKNLSTVSTGFYSNN